jgi:hypothetical protein
MKFCSMGQLHGEASTVPRRLLVVGRKPCIGTALHQDTRNRNIPVQKDAIMTKVESKLATLVAGVLLVCLVFAQAAQADEGMWTFDNFPSKTLGQSMASRPRRSGSTTYAYRRCASPAGARRRSFLRRDW